MADDQFAAGFMDDYFAECEEHLATIRRLLLALESDTGRQMATASVLEELFRSFHSIKGISGMVELREAEMLAHHMESYLRALRQREAQLSDAGMDALIRGVDALEQTIAARREGVAPPAIDQTIGRLAAVEKVCFPFLAPGAGRLQAIGQRPDQGRPVAHGGVDDLTCPAALDVEQRRDYSERQHHSPAGIVAEVIDRHDR